MNRQKYLNQPKTYIRYKQGSSTNMKNSYTNKVYNYKKRDISKGTASDAIKNKDNQYQNSKNDSQEPKINSNQNLIKFKDIICPECGQHSLINIKDYKITLYDCINNHKNENILLREFMETQQKGLSCIKCESCIINNKNKTDKNEFYRCLDCRRNLCPNCIKNHDKGHKIVFYEQIYYICPKHNYSYINYCNTCKKNICSRCSYEHYGHTIKAFQSLYESKNYVKIEMDEMKSKVEKFNKIIDEYKNILENTKYNMEIFYNINCNIFNNCHKDYQNYEVLSNLNTINENYKMEDIDSLINEKNIIKRFSLICDLYKKMNNKEEIKSSNNIYLRPNSKLSNTNDKNKTKGTMGANYDYKKDTTSSNNTLENSQPLNPQLNNSNFRKNNNKYNNYNKSNNYNKPINEQEKSLLSGYLNNKDGPKRINYKDNNQNINDDENSKQNTSKTNNSSIKEVQNNYNMNNNRINIPVNKKIYINAKDNARNVTHDNFNLRNKNEKYNLNVMKNNDNNIEQKLPPPDVTELKSEAQKEQREKAKEKQKETKNFVSTDKYGKKENILKNRLAEKIPIEVKEKEIEYTSSKKPKGLYNLGLSCYMNSLLQCLYHIKEIRDFFIKEKDKFTNKKPVCKALAEVMYGLKNDKKDYFEAIEFKKIMGSKNSLFQGFKAGDAKDLFINLIDSLLTELTDENEDNDDIEENVDLTKKSDAFRITKEEIKDNIINNLFIGYYETIYKCKNSKKINTYAFSTESFISFNLEKITQYFQNRTLSIEDCFEYNYNRTYKTSFFCDKCKDTEENNSNDVIFVPPKIFVLVLDRGHGKTFRGKIDFKTDIDLEGLIDKKDNTNKFSTKYKLIGVSTHAGRSSSSGHYTACCLSDNGKYYYFSDTFVEEVSERSIYDNEPYLLFYKRYDTFSTPN